MEEYDHHPPRNIPTFIQQNNHHLRNKLYVATYNVRSLSSYERLIELQESLVGVKYDIIGLAEVRRLGSKIEEYKDFILFYKGETPGKHGVGFLIKTSLKENIESFNAVTERVILLNLNIQGYCISIIQVYAPTESADEEEINKFYYSIDKAIQSAHKKIIVMGDFNAKIGQTLRDEYLITKRYGYGQRNERGQRLLNFAFQNKLSIINTYFKKKPSRRWTWQSPNGQYKNEIDYITTNQPNIFQNIETLNLNFSSDHRLLRSTILLSKPHKSRIAYANKHTSTLKSDENIKEYKKCLEKNLSNWKETNTVQRCYDSLKSSIMQSLEVKNSSNQSITKHKILSEDTLSLLRRRKSLQTIKNKSRMQRNELSALYKLTGKYIKLDYKTHRETIIKKHLEQNGSLKSASKELRTHRAWIDGLNHLGRTSYKRKDIVNTATNFYRDLYSSKPEDHIQNSQITYHNTDTLQGATEEEKIQPIEELEILQAIKRLKSDKSPGPDKVTNEAVRYGAALLATPLTYLFNLIIETAVIPTQWSESNIILLYKKGDPHDIGNYRPISLLPTLYKLFSSIINNRISETIDKCQPIEQAGFRKGFSTIDHIHTLELIIEKYMEKQTPLYIAFVDYKKAFDTISHTSIWEALKAQKVENKYIEIIRRVYNKSTSKVKLETTGQSFTMERGVKQGDPLSPKLFIAVLENIIRNLDWHKHGLNVNGRYLSHLRFADDIVLLSETSRGLQHMLETLHVNSKHVGLEMNLSKTKVMTNSIKKSIMLEEVQVEYVEHYIYLGKHISFKSNSNELEIERRIKHAWNKYWGLKEVFKSNLPLKLKKKTMDSCILPSLTYACQTWKLTKKMKNKISSCQKGMERSMLNIKKIHKIRHTKIRTNTKVIDALAYAQIQKFRWAGHIARYLDNRWTINVTTWKGPPGKRRVGRPHVKWEDDIRQIAGTNWLQIAKNKEKWKSLEEAFT